MLRRHRYLVPAAPILAVLAGPATPSVVAPAPGPQRR